MEIADLFKKLEQGKAEDIVSSEYIHIKGARTHNLKNVEVNIPKNELIVVTGLSGSGKSTLIMDTLYAEGQRRYVESLSSYARQFLNRMKKPEVDFIKGISPAIAIEQRKASSNARSTVGSLTEIYDYLRLLYARVGKMFSPLSGEIVKKHEVSDVVDYVVTQKDGTKIELHAPFVIHDDERTLKKELDILLKKGNTKVDINGERYDTQDLLESGKKILGNKIDTLDLQNSSIVIDRWVYKSNDESLLNRIADSIHTAFLEGGGEATIKILGGSQQTFNNRYALDGLEFPEPSPALFNYNSPYGACPKCEGYGRVLGVSEDKVIPNKNLSIYENAVAAWSGEKLSKWKRDFIKSSATYDFPVHDPYNQLSDKYKDILWDGAKGVRGIHDFFNKLESKSYKIQNRVLLARYRGRTFCPECKSYRLRKEALYVKINDTHIGQLTKMPLDRLLEFVNTLNLNEQDEKIAERLIYEIKARLQIMNNIGLTYLDLDRLAGTLSGGETQRIHLTRILGSNLTQSIYILDEPTIGLHPKDTEQIIKVLKELRDLENTVIVIEHEEDVIRAADYIIEIGPDAGVHGGEIVYDGKMKNFLKAQKLSTHTLRYINDEVAIPVPEVRRKSQLFIEVIGASHHNLKNIDVRFPLNAFTVVSGVSGSGKSTLINHVLTPSLLKNVMNDYSKKIGSVEKVTGAWQELDAVEYIDQNPIGRSSRSNPVTYIKAYDNIRKLMASQQLAKINGFKTRHFSFNTEGGRCETCQGDGYVTIEMQFLADVHLDCDDCKGRRFKDEVLDVKYHGKSIYDILELSVSEAIDFFEEEKSIVNKLMALNDVGLGYIKLGQASNTLSGGEAQRVKLASFLINDKAKKHTLFIFDEPTTGLHLHDVNVLLNAFDSLVEQGNTLIVVEHNMDVIKSADWLIDLGPQGGVHGGEVLYQGAPEGILNVEKSHTASFLRDKL